MILSLLSRVTRRPFLALLVCAAAQLLTQVGYGIYVIVQFGTSTGDFDRRGAFVVAVPTCLADRMSSNGGRLDTAATSSPPPRTCARIIGCTPRAHLPSSNTPHPRATTLTRTRPPCAVRQTYPVLDGAVFFGLTVAITALAIVALGLVVQLLSFHIYLIVHGLTTYDYIVNRAQGGTGSGGSASSRAGVSSTKRSSRARSGRGRSQSPQHHKSQAHHHGGLASPSRADPAIAAAAAAAAAEEGGAIASATTTVTGEGGAAASAAAPGAPEGTIAATTAAPDAVSVQLHPPPVTVIAAPSSPLRDLSSAPPPVPAIGDAAPGDGPGGGISVV